MDSNKEIDKDIKQEDTSQGKFKRVLKFLIFLAIAGAIYWFSNAFGLANSGFTDTTVLSTYNFYINSAFSFLLALIPIFFIEFLITYKDITYGNGIGVTDNGSFPALSFFKKLSSFQIFLIFLIIFLILGLIVFKSSSKQIIFGDVNPLAKEQFSPLGGIIWGNLIVPLSENLGLACVIGLILVSLRGIARKYKMNRNNFYVLSLLLVIFGGAIYGLFVHFQHYSGQEQSLFVVLLFWMVMSVLIFFTGSFIPSFLMHLMNNLMGDLSTLISSKDLVFYGMIGIVIGLIILYLWMYVFRKSKKKSSLK